jgi:hypothetical protein
LKNHGCARSKARLSRREPRKLERGVAMPSKKKMGRMQPRRQASTRTLRRSVASRPEGVATSRLNDLAEALDIMLPELTARIAALEHLLVEKGFCTHEDLVRSREFVDLSKSRS